jgi:DNA (cytosine-5)-methyltransferase 1
MARADQGQFEFEPDSSIDAAASEPRTCRVAGLFAGIGGLEFGLASNGHTTKILCEIDPSAQAVLMHHKKFRSVPIISDVRALHRIGDVDLLTAGFPCQDLSQAGKTRGLEGKNSGLIHAVFEILERNEIPEVLLENVPFMLRLSKGGVMETILSRLEQLDYKWAYRLIDAQAFGLPQRRQRVFIFASKDRDPRTILLGGKERRPPPSAWNPELHAAGFYWTEGNRGIGWAVDSLPTLKGGSTVGIPSPPAALLPDGRVVTPTIEAAERLQGFPRNWTRPAAAVGRGSLRWKLVGNAVNVRVSAWLGDRLARPVPYDGIGAHPLPDNSPWPTSAWCLEPGRRWTCAASGPYPANDRRRTGLLRFLRDEHRPLSEKALRGFYTRLERSTLRSDPRFREGLARALDRRQS